MPLLLRRLGNAFWLKNDAGAPAPYTRYEMGRGGQFRGRLLDPKLLSIYNKKSYFILRVDLNEEAEVVGEALVSVHHFVQYAQRAFDLLFAPHAATMEKQLLATLVSEEQEVVPAGVEDLVEVA